MGYGGPHAGLPRDARRVQALDARPPGRRQRRRARRRRPTASRCRRASSTSAARRRRRTSARRRCCSAVIASMYAVYHGPRGPDAHRAARAPAHRDPGAGPASSWASTLADARAFDTLDRRRPATRTDAILAARARRRHQPAPRRRRARSASRSTRPRRAPTSQRCGASFAPAAHALPRVADARRAASRRADPAGAARAPAPSSRTRCSTRYHSETEMLRYLRSAGRQGPRARPRDDPARLVHDEAQRDQRDDPGHLARVRATSIRSRPPTSCRATRELDRPARATGCAQATGYARRRLQPNAGSQGEYAGLLAIKAYHEAAARATATSA